MAWILSFIGFCLTGLSQPITPIDCEGSYGGHLQGIASDGKSLFWSHTVALVKTDLSGRMLQRVEVPTHHGDLTCHDGEVFVAVELGEFNRLPGESRPWIYVYDADTLEFGRRHAVPELVHGCGGIAYRKETGQFILVGGLPPGFDDNFLFEYDRSFRFIRRHRLPSGYTRLGIQTAAFFDNHWWFGCYGAPGNPGLLQADSDFNLTGQAPADFSFGIVRIDGQTVLRGECFDQNRRGRAVWESLPLTVVPAPHPRVRVVAYNVLFGNWAEPERVGEMLRAHEPDIVGFSEVPDGDWSARAGKAAGLKYAYVGSISSANHRNKYKSIVSRSPLTGLHEVEIQPAQGWKPASAVAARTTVHGVPLLVYSTHIPGRPHVSESSEGSAAASLATAIQSRIAADNVILLGDLNNLPGDAPLNLLDAIGMRSMWTDLAIDTARLSTHKHIESGSESGVIDHIYYGGPWSVRAVEGGVIHDAFNPVDEDKPMDVYRAEWDEYSKPLSDHRPVRAVLGFRLPGESD